MKFKDAISKALSERNISRKQFAKEINVSEPTVGKYIRGELVPSNKTLRKIEAVLGLKNGSLQSIVDESRKPKTTKEGKQYEKEKSIESKILIAWKRGDRSPYEVSKITGYSMRTIGRYLPIGDCK